MMVIDIDGYGGGDGDGDGLALPHHHAELGPSLESHLGLAVVQAVGCRHHIPLRENFCKTLKSDSCLTNVI